jgi:hypothetical protein
MRASYDGLHIALRFAQECEDSLPENEVRDVIVAALERYESGDADEQRAIAGDVLLVPDPVGSQWWQLVREVGLAESRRSLQRNVALTMLRLFALPLYGAVCSGCGKTRGPREIAIGTVGSLCIECHDKAGWTSAYCILCGASSLRGRAACVECREICEAIFHGRSQGGQPR